MQKLRVKKIAIIRFSSIGDIIQCMSVVSGIKNNFPNAEIHWITRTDMASIVEIHPLIASIHKFDRKLGFIGLIQFGKELKKENFDLIYDAHNNLRSHVLKFILCRFSFCRLSNTNKWITRRKYRFKRFLLFKFSIDLFPKPNIAVLSYQKPLQKIGISNFNTKSIQWQFTDEVKLKASRLLKSIENKPWITIVPSAAWPLKRWDVEYWKKLIVLEQHFNFVILGGKDDTFCEEIKNVAAKRALNLAGETSLMESLYIISISPFVISGDTGLLHAADLFYKKGIALIGPTAFGYPSSNDIKVLEINLPCRPCTKDGSTDCKIREKKKCLKDITPQMVSKSIKKHYPKD